MNMKLKLTGEHMQVLSGWIADKLQALGQPTSLLGCASHMMILEFCERIQKACIGCRHPRTRRRLVSLKLSEACVLLHFIYQLHELDTSFQSAMIGTVKLQLEEILFVKGNFNPNQFNYA